MTARHPGPLAAPALASTKRGLIASGAVALALMGAMALDTAVVQIGSAADTRQQAFSPDAFGATEFPRIQSLIAEKAVDAQVLAPEVLADKLDYAGFDSWQADQREAILDMLIEWLESDSIFGADDPVGTADAQVALRAWLTRRRP